MRISDEHVDQFKHAEGLNTLCSLFLLCQSTAATIRGRLLFEGGFYLYLEVPSVQQSNKKVAFEDLAPSNLYVAISDSYHLEGVSKKISKNR